MNAKSSLELMEEALASAGLPGDIKRVIKQPCLVEFVVALENRNIKVAMCCVIEAVQNHEGEGGGLAIYVSSPTLSIDILEHLVFNQSNGKGWAALCNVSGYSPEDGCNLGIKKTRFVSEFIPVTISMLP